MVGPPEFRGSYCAGGVALSRPKQMFEFESLFSCANRRHSSRQRWHQSSIAFMIPPMKCTTPSAGAPVGPAVPAPVQQRTQWSVTLRHCERNPWSTFHAAWRLPCSIVACLRFAAQCQAQEPMQCNANTYARNRPNGRVTVDGPLRLAARARLMRSYRCALRVVRHTVDRMMQAYRRSGRNNRCML